jgi:hypothetical protein
LIRVWQDCSGEEDDPVAKLLLPEIRRRQLH